MEATGRGQFVGVTMSVLQNQDYWWGEGDDMFFIDGEKSRRSSAPERRTISWAPGISAASLSPMAYMARRWWEEEAGSRSSVYRFHLDQPIPFTKSLKATIEHGSADHRSDNFYSVAYWYQTEPHAAFPVLPPVEERLPRLHMVGGPGNAAQ